MTTATTTEARRLHVTSIAVKTHCVLCGYDIDPTLIFAELEEPDAPATTPAGCNPEDVVHHWRYDLCTDCAVGGEAHLKQELASLREKNRRDWERTDAELGEAIEGEWILPTRAEFEAYEREHEGELSGATADALRAAMCRCPGYCSRCSEEAV